MFVSKKTRRQIGHHVCLRDVMSQTHPIYACAGNNHARHLISSQCISLQLEARAFKVTLEKKNLMGGKSRAYGTVWSIILENYANLNESSLFAKRRFSSFKVSSSFLIC